jgi:hypothetical protein
LIAVLDTAGVELVPEGGDQSWWRTWRATEATGGAACLKEYSASGNSLIS